MWPHIPKMFCWSFFCRLRSKVKSTNQHLFSSACITSHSGLTYCAARFWAAVVKTRVQRAGCCEPSGKQLCRYSEKHAGNSNVVTVLLQL